MNKDTKRNVCVCMRMCELDFYLLNPDLYEIWGPFLKRTLVKYYFCTKVIDKDIYNAKSASK